MKKIDFVITWVDGNDPAWLEEKKKYDVNIPGKASAVNRYRDWDNLQYWFRGVEQFAPWVNKIHFVTWGHVPKWLNTNHPKLNIVKHEDFIPSKYLPTFSANPIELNLHRIKELEDCFVYFNDDMFITQAVKPNDFFVKGLPCDIGSFNILDVDGLDDIFPHILLNDIAAINRNFPNKKRDLKMYRKWFHYKYGIDANLRTFLLLRWLPFTGFIYSHLPSSIRKETCLTVWEKEEQLLDETCLHKFRDIRDVNQYIFKFWQMAEGEFQPRSMKIGQHFNIFSSNNNRLYESIEQKKYKLICINDDSDTIDFEKEKNRIIQAFDCILPEKSSFEL